MRAARQLLVLALAGGALACGSREPAPAPPPAPEAAPDAAVERRVDSERLMSTVRTLASPEYGGRKTGSPGNHLARELIVERFRASGLPPLKGSYELPFRFNHYSVRGIFESDRPFRTVYDDAANLAATTGPAASVIVVSALKSACVPSDASPVF